MRGDAVFHAAPVALLLIRASDLVMVDANEAYCDLVGLSADELVGRGVFEVFPNSPLNEEGDQQADLRALIDRAIRERQRVGVDMIRYDIRLGDRFEVRWWTACESPILDEDGTVTHLLHSTEDVTEQVRTQRDLVEVSGRVTRLSDVAQSLRSADTVEDLVRIVVEQGLAVLGADGGGLVTRSEGGDWLVSSSEVFDEDTRQYAVTPYDTPLAGQTAARTGQRVLLGNREEAVAFHPVMADVYDLTGHTAWAFLPLVVEDRSIGAVMAAWLDEQRFDDEEALAVMEGFAAQCALALDRIEKSAAERRTAGLVRDLAEALQSAMLTEPPAVDGVDLAVRYRSASDVARVGGDWYDSFLQPDGALMLVIGDVVGHDDVAAGKMSQLRGLLRGLAYDGDGGSGDSPAAVLRRVERVAAGLGVDELSSVVLARLDPPTAEGSRRLAWSNAGNVPPVVVLPDGGTALLDGPDLLLGVDPDAARADHALALAPGSLVLLYTDGLVERRGESIDQGVAELRAALADLRGLPVEELCDRLLERLAPHLGEDDVAMVVARV